MSKNHRVNGQAIDLAGATQNAISEARAKRQVTEEMADALEQARGIDTLAVAQRLPSGHVLLPRFPDGALVALDAKRVAAIEPMQPAGWVDLSKLGEDRPEVCQVTFEFGTMMFVGTVAEIAGLLFGEAS